MGDLKREIRNRMEIVSLRESLLRVLWRKSQKLRKKRMETMKKKLRLTENILQMKSRRKMMVLHPKETTEPTKMILLIQRMIIREMIEDLLQETEDVLVLGREDLDLVVVGEDLTLAKEGEAEVGIVEAGVVKEEAGAEIEDVTEVARE